MLSTALILTVLAASPAPQAAAADAHPVVVIDTTAGPIAVELDRARAPISVDNFLKYVDKGFYNGLTFHRVIPGFMIQGGGMKEANGTLQEVREGAFPPIQNESSNGLKHARGTIAMARTPDPNSATSQFFINHGNNAALDRAPGGYTVFGKVIDGLDVVDAIAKSETTTKADVGGQPHDDVPIKPIVIKTIKRKAPG